MVYACVPRNFTKRPNKNANSASKIVKCSVNFCFIVSRTYIVDM